MRLTLDGIRDPRPWQAVGIELPHFDIPAMRQRTAQAPQWLHIGPGNIFRAFPAALQQQLLEQGQAQTGIIACESWDPDGMQAGFKPYDNLTLAVTMRADGALEKRVIASVAETMGAQAPQQTSLTQIAQAPSLQMISLTITEKGYALTDGTGKWLPAVEADMAQSQSAQTAMGLVAWLLLRRFEAGAGPIALLSLDNCADNGGKLRAAVTTIAKAWVQGGHAPQGFLPWLETCGFPVSMIDKIVPSPAPAVKAALESDGLEDMQVTRSARGTVSAGFVNAEGPQTLVIEEDFPNGRPPLELVGVLFCDRETVTRVEHMKVSACLNPLHTALAVLGFLLEKPTIAACMEDEALRTLVTRLAYQELLPAVEPPGILEPADFLRTVLQERLPNRALPDAPVRIATDTSQKLSPRFGPALRWHAAQKLAAPPLTTFVLAAYLRYLMAVDDNGQPMQLSADPALERLQGVVAHLRLGQPGDMAPVQALLSDAALFGLDLTVPGYDQAVLAHLQAMITGPGAVRKALTAVCAPN